MNPVGMILKGVRAAAGYTAARSKERSTALGGGLCIAALYFRVTHPRAMDETMFYIVFGLGAVVALLKTEFMRAMAVGMVDAARGRSQSKSKHQPQSKSKSSRKGGRK